RRLPIGVGLHHGRFQRRAVFRRRPRLSRHARRGACAHLRRRAGLRPRRRQRHADGLVGLLLDDPRRKTRAADTGKPRRGTGSNRGRISASAERDRRHRRAVNCNSSWPGLTRPSTPFSLRHCKTWMPGTRPGMTYPRLNAFYSTSARFALVETVFGTEVAGGATSRLASGGGVSLASISAATGATFISPSRAR